MPRAPKVEFEINCGDWIYPSRDSSTKVQYDINFPLVALIFVTKKRAENNVENARNIGYHLTGPRYLTCEIISGRVVGGHALKIIALKNFEEEDFEKPIGAEIQFDARALCRGSELWPHAFSNSFSNETKLKDTDWWSILFSSVILQAHINNRDRELPEGIIFREARIPEIEALGRW